MYCHGLNKGATDRLLDVMSNVHLGVENSYEVREVTIKSGNNMSKLHNNAKTFRIDRLCHRESLAM